MATPPITIQLMDDIDSNIESKIIAIGTAARDSDDALKALQRTLSSLSSSGLSGLKADIDSAAGSATKLGQAVQSATTSQKDYTTSAQQVTSANNENATSTSRLATLMLQLREARQSLAIATKNLQAAEQALGQAAAGGNVQAQQIIATMRQEQLAAAELVISLRAAQREAQNFANSQNKVATASHGSITPVMAASAAIRGIEGNFGTSVRAGERFLVTTLKLGPILQAAFPIFGALAFLGILDILAQHVGKLIQAYRNLSIEIRNAEVAAIIAGDKILKVKPEGFFSASNFARIIDNNPNKPQQLEVQNAQAKLKEIQYAKQLADANAVVVEKGLEGLALQKQKVIDVQQEIEFTKQAKQQVDILAQSYKSLLTETTKDTRFTGGKEDRHAITEEHLKITDPNQVKALEAELKTTVAASEEMQHEVEMLGVKLRGAKLHEPIMAAKDAMKAAREQLKQFREELAQVKINAGGVITPQQELATLEAQRKRALPANIPEVDTHIGVATQAIERQKLLVADLTQKWQDQVETIGLYSNKLKEANDFDKAMNTLRRDNIVLTQEQTNQLKELIHTVVSSVEFQHHLKTVYDEFNAPLRNYTAAQQAITKLEKDGVISKNQSAIALNEATRAYRDAVEPLTEYLHGLQKEVDLFGLYGDRLKVVTQIQQVQEQLRQKGRALTQQETQQLSAFLTQLEKQKQLQTDINKLYEQNAGQMQRLVTQMAAILAARQRGIISEQQEKIQLNQLKVQIAELNIEMGKFTKSDVLTAVFGSYIKNFKGFTTEVINLWQQTFNTIADGAAQALGRAIAYGENLGKALKDVARQALSELIAGMVKLGIQMLITALMGSTIAHVTAATTIATAAAVASAWAPAAALASLATLGANAAPADTALISTTTLAGLLAMVHMNQGGIVPGFGNKDIVPAMLTPGEFVLKASAVRDIGINNLQALNSGSRGIQTSAGDGLRSRMQISVIHDGSTAVAVDTTDDEHIKIIAQREAKRAVETQSPGVIAGSISDANSAVSKSLGRHTTSRRSR